MISPVGKPRGKASRESHRSLDPREGKRVTAATPHGAAVLRAHGPLPGQRQGPVTGDGEFLFNHQFIQGKSLPIPLLVFLKQEWQVSRAGLAAGSYSAALHLSLVTEEGLSKKPEKQGYERLHTRSSFEP